MFLLLVAACASHRSPPEEEAPEVIVGPSKAEPEADEAPITLGQQQLAVKVPADDGVLGAKREEGNVGRKGEAPGVEGESLEQALGGVTGAQSASGAGATSIGDVSSIPGQPSYLGGVEGQATGLGGLGTRGSGLGGGGTAGGRGDASVGGMSGGVHGGAALGANSGVGSGSYTTKSPPASQGYAYRAPEPPPAPSPRVAFNWGATTWLSNDDSMSLASAQRLLWEVERGQSVSPGEIRPHEFLNYFSFAANRPAAGATFALTGSAERTSADTLTVALAVQAGIPDPTPMALTLVVDRSGSMSDAGKMAFLKRGLKRMVSQLRRGDHVDLVAFDDRVDTIFSDLVAGRDDARILAAIDSLAPRGSTDMNAGLRRGYDLARSHARTDRRRILVVTDALLNTGDVDPDVVSEIGRALDQDGIRLSAVGVGADVNDRMLDKLTEKGKGAYVYLGSEVVTDRVFGPMFHALTETVAEDVRISLDLPDSLGVARFYGEESSTTKADVQSVNVHAGTTQLFLEDLKIRDTGVSPDDRLVVHIEWDDPVAHVRKQKDSSFTVGQLLDADGRNVRKARALMAWTDEIQARASRGESCGSSYDTWLERSADIRNDAELAWLDGLLAKTCARREPIARASYKVKVDADQVIAEVQLDCGGRVLSDDLGAGESVARFADVRAGSCTLTLMGNTPMAARVEVSPVGGEARCTVRAGRVDCAG